ncbi:MAG: ABC transporter permease [Bacillota bacterium]|nr:ABC transporter permease [Bacillota bacterium]
MLASGYNPLPAYAALFVGAFGTPFNIATTLAHSVPLMLTGLGVAVAFRSGLFNIGAEGQFWVGSIATTWVGYAVGGLPPALHVALALLAGAVAGALWGALVPGLLKAYTGAHEVITTMMMTYVAIQLSHFLLEGGPMQAPGYTPVSPDIRPSAFLPLLVPRTQLSAGLFIALGAAVIAWLILERTTLGYRMRAVGFNARAAAYAGIDVAATTVLALGLSGAFAGVAGAVEVLGVNHRLYDSFTAGYGFTAIVVALLAKNDPWATLGAALLFGALSTGASYMQLSAGVPSQLVDVVQGIIIFFIAADAIIAWLLRRSRNRKEVAA